MQGEEDIEISSELLSGKPAFSEDEITAVSNVLRSGWVGSGNEVILFEQEIAAYTGAKNVVCVDSCTSALFLSLKCLGVKEGDEVIVPTLTWCSSANAAIYCGATPVFCDIDEKTLCVSGSTVISCITPKTKAVIVVHYAGYAVNVEELKNVLPKGIHIVEDAAHAFGATYSNGKKVGSSGNLTCFSFYANKNLSTAEGGAVCTSNTDLAKELKSIRQHGIVSNAWAKKTDLIELEPRQPHQLGYKMNYIDLHACIGRVQLKKFDAMQEIRDHIVTRYVNEVKALFPELHFQEGLCEIAHAKHLAVVILPKTFTSEKRNALLLNMRLQKIGASIHYMPLHTVKFYQYSFGTKHLPNSESIYARIITLPLSATMNDVDIDRVIKTFAAEYKQSSFTEQIHK